MTEQKKKIPQKAGPSFGEALARFIQTKPSELAEAIMADVIQARERATKRIQEAREEIEDGARPRKGRFRL